MTFLPRESVRAGLDHLETRLDPIITDRLAAELHGLPWTTVLVELDKARGKAPRHYNSSDVQSQLRMITERLGGLGFPFDTPARLVSTLGNELRIVRNSEKHNDELTTVDAWRAHDTSVRLLEHFGDAAGATTAAHLRNEAFVAVVAESGLHPAPVAAPSGTAEPTTDTAAPPALAPDAESEAELVEPDDSVLERDTAEQTPIIGPQRVAFDPWTVTLIGDIAVLDGIGKKVNKEKVRALAAEIVDYEGPIHIDRLAQLIAASFGVQKLYAKRQQKIAYQVRQTGLTVDGDKFVWSADLDPATWNEFRPNNSDVRRAFTHISPVEIANAMRFLQQRRPELDRADLQAATLRTFGRKKRTTSLVAHLEKAADSVIV